VPTVLASSASTALQAWTDFSAGSNEPIKMIGGPADISLSYPVSGHEAGFRWWT
jgi:hypothetical protein